MAPVNKVRTYGRSNNSVMNNSVNAFNELFAKNITKRLIGKNSKNRKNHHIFIKELPPRSTCGTLLANDSLEISTEDTFDKLLRKNKKEVAKPDINISKCNTSKSLENAMKSESSFTQISTFYSPIMTRKRKKGASITEMNSKQLMMTDKSKGSSNPYLYRLNAPTIDGIDVSLEIEKVQEQKFEKSSSFLVLSAKPKDHTHANISINNIFTRTFRERQFIHSSTPVASQKFQKKIINHTISPIKNLSCLVKESFEEIKRWESKFPSVDEPNDCSDKCPTPRKTMNRSVKISSPESSNHFLGFSKIEQQCGNIKGTEDESSKNGTSSSYCSGFSKIDQSKNIKRIEDENSKNDICDSKNNMNFITLRRRQIPKLDVEKMRGRSRRKKTLPDDNCVVSLDNFNSFEAEINTSANSKNTDSTMDQSSYIRAGQKRIFPVKESQISTESQINYSEQKSLVVSLDTFTTFETHNNPSDSKHFHSINAEKLQEEVLEPPLNFFTKRRKRLSENDLLHNVTKSKRCRSARSLNFSEAQYNTDDDTFRMSRDMIVNVTRLQKVNNTESGGLSLFDFENFYSRNNSRNNILRYKSANDTVGSTSIISTVQERKTLVVNVTRRDEINSVDFENFYEKNILMEKLNCDNELTNHEDGKELGVNVSIRRGFSESVDKDTKKELIVNVTQNIFEDFYTKNYSSDHNTDASGATESSEEISSNFLYDDGKNHYSTSIIESSYVEPDRKINKISSHLQVTKSRSKKVDQTVPDLMNFSTNDDSDNTHKEISYIDLTDSLDELVNPTLPKTPDSSNIIESSILESSQKDNDGFKVPMVLNTRKGPTKKVLLKAGKSWRRSLSNHKKSSVLLGSINEEKSILENDTIAGPSDQILNKRFSIKIVPIETSSILRNKRRTTLLEEYAVNTTSYVPGQKILEDNLENSLRCLSLRRSTTLVQESLPVTAREVVLRRCGQTEPIPFSKCYPQSALHHCQKIGEGVYGEVFLYRNPAGGTSVMKVIPIEGDQIVNGERQKKFDEILSEVVIAMELSNLRNNKKNATSSFSLVQNIHCVRGHYPEKLLDLWELFEETRGSENDCPDLFGDDQLYIVLELENAGSDLEAFVFNNALQAYSMFKQVAFGLAVAEEELRFEHRDLHWGNVLLNTVDRNDTVEFSLDGEKYRFPSKGVQATIIDFTLSRIEYDGVVIFNDLGTDPDLFTAEGDYQFQIYRAMQKRNRNNWQGFEPYSNLLWLHYILDKAVTALRYKNTGSKIHKENLLKMTQLSKEILTYKSVKDFVLNSPL
ncbi:unnamed protein product [Phaedon cochleariae]|uniref:non-specific serine/threonine protein kinase n=1 Tax=Phaedon cochleariae TaxID=80249 RepID=A0A9P0GRZ8_PHACE|nr:unnamed protein product [Phaedon cochleariae]